MVKTELPELLVSSSVAWRAWLEEHHADSAGVWLVLHKKGGAVTTLTYADALDEALCFGWIDGQVRKRDTESFCQRMTPRRKGSRWSARNVEHIERLEGEGRMRPAGRAAVDRAVASGEWERAYAGQSTAEMPNDLQRAIDADAGAAEVFRGLNAVNRYALIYRVNATKTPTGRARCIKRLVAKLAMGDIPHP